MSEKNFLFEKLANVEIGDIGSLHSIVYQYIGQYSHKLSLIVEKK